MRKWLGYAVAATFLTGVPLVAVQATNFAILLSSPDRPDADKARDADRKPAELMKFAGVKPGAKVVELAPGGGYFTRLLSLAVGPAGKVIGISNRNSPAVEEWAKTHPNTSVTVGQVGATFGAEPVDIVWTTLNYHDFKNTAGLAERINNAAFASLKPGGVYLVVDHEAAAGAGATVTNSLHRIESAAVIADVQAAGFRLDGQSDLLRHPADDHSQKVFETGVRGKTDQFVLRFKKPKKR
jgi:predicted methyltransferase